MPNPSRSQAIKLFLEAKTHFDLASMYNHDMEVQVNVARGNGTRIEQGDFKEGRGYAAFTDGTNTWKPFRMPLQANSDPQDNDGPMSFSLEQHAEGIGMTGWDWQKRLSRWVAFDFDAIVGHSDKHSKKLDDSQLAEVQKVVSNIPFVTVRKSTSGKGLHLYVYLEPVDTANHNEHAALARAILSMLSGLTGFDFASKVDTCGGNMWIWHRKMYNDGVQNDGLRLVKHGDMLRNVPQNWRDHIPVVTNRSRRATPCFVYDLKTNDPEQLFGELSGQRTRVQIDTKHRQLIDWLSGNGCVWWWDQDSHMLVTHTVHLKGAHTALRMKGNFDTLASGKDKGYDHNCFGGDTEVLTREGAVKIRDLVGETELFVKTDKGMQWITCEIKSFGKQKTYLTCFGDGNYVRSTYNHSWLTSKDRLETWELKPGKTQIPLAPLTLCDPDMEGYAHGFVFGDGWQHRGHCDVALFKHDNDLFRLLSRFGNPGTQKYEGHGYINMVRSLPNNWKELPSNPTKEYALGFILGLMSADGFVSNNIQIFQSDYSILEQIRQLAIFAGLRVGNIRLYGIGDYPNAKQGYALSINTYNIKPEWIIRQDQRSNFKRRKKSKYTTVSFINWSEPIEEEVFCAVVPIYHNFTLANGVVTGNCFCFPLRDGGWIVRRYSLGTKEHETWDNDGSGWTRCFYNRDPDLHTLARIHDGVEHEKGGYAFAHAESVAKVLLAMGISVELPGFVMSRKSLIRPINKENKLVVKIEAEGSDDGTKMKGWLNEKKQWVRVFLLRLSHATESESSANYDDLLRHLVSCGDEDAGWVFRRENIWSSEPLVHIRAALGSLGHDAKEVSQIIGSGVVKAWTLVNRPFQPEYPGNREWNRNAAQFAVAPTTELDNLSYPTWLRIMEHCGGSLDDAISKHKWCQNVGITRGSQFLMLWIASMLKQPHSPTTYLAFWGNQDCGKSIFHEAISEILITRGAMRADNALQSQQNFNGELEACILAVVEETDLRRDKTAYNRIKDWVTSPRIMIRPLYTNPYMVQNTTHWVQCANDPEACPIFEGDTRITMIHVPDLKKDDLIPKPKLMQLLRKEAPDFLAAVLAIELPESDSRLAVPTIDTEMKKRAALRNRTLLETFIADVCLECPGHFVSKVEFHEKMQEWLEARDRLYWTQQRIARELPERIPRGRMTSNPGTFYGNLTFDRDAQPIPGKHYVAVESGNAHYLKLADK